MPIATALGMGIMSPDLSRISSMKGRDHIMPRLLAAGVNYQHDSEFAGFCPKACARGESKDGSGSPAAGEDASTASKRTTARRNTTLGTVSPPVFTLIAGANGAGKKHSYQGQSGNFQRFSPSRPGYIHEAYPCTQFGDGDCCGAGGASLGKHISRER